LSGKRVKDRRPEQGGGYRTAALFRAAVMRPLPRQGGGFVTEEKKAKKRGEKGKIKHAGAKRSMQGVNAHSESFSGSRTPCEETCIIIGACVTLFWQFSTLQFWVRT
ncbi:hypothetical protein KI387_019732, partial [Taxus chinensis]